MNYKILYNSIIDKYSVVPNQRNRKYCSKECYYASKRK